MRSSSTTDQFRYERPLAQITETATWGDHQVQDEEEYYRPHRRDSRPVREVGVDKYFRSKSRGG